MRNARLAESILSLVTTPERASATIGDLLEDRRHASALRFWGAVLFAALLLLWQDVAASPLRMAQLAALGVGLQLLLSVAVAVGFGLLFLLVRTLAGSLDMGPEWSRRLGVSLIMLLALIRWAFVLITKFQVGRVLAKQSPGRELAPCVATTLLGSTVAFLIVVLSGGRAQFPTGHMIRDVIYGPSPALFVVSQIPLLLALLAGAARVRRQRLSISS